MGSDFDSGLFLSRSEFRLSLRADNADLRLTPLGRALGAIREDRWTSFAALSSAVEELRSLLGSTHLTPREWAAAGVTVRGDGQRRSGLRILEYNDITSESLVRAIPGAAAFSDEVLERVMLEGRYASYLVQQQAQVEQFRREDAAMQIPSDIDYALLGGLSSEAREKLSKHRPANISAAGRIPGITPAHIMTIIKYTRNQEKAGQKERMSAFSD